MKKLLMGIAAMSMVVPSMASAGTAAQALSVKAAAVQPVRAAAQPGETKFIKGAPLVLLALGALGVLIYVLVDGDSN